MKCDAKLVLIRESCRYNIVELPRPYSQDLRWRAIYLVEIVGLGVQEVSIYLNMSPKTISRYVNKFRRLGNVNTGVIGRPYACISIHPHEEFVIMESLLKYPERTLAEIINDMCRETGSMYGCSTIYYYLKRNNLTRKKVCEPVTASDYDCKLT